MSKTVLIFALTIVNGSGPADAKGADVNFDDLVITGGGAETIRIDTCTGHVSSEFLQRRYDNQSAQNIRINKCTGLVNYKYTEQQVPVCVNNPDRNMLGPYHQ